MKTAIDIMEESGIDSKIINSYRDGGATMEELRTIIGTIYSEYQKENLESEQLAAKVVKLEERIAHQSNTIKEQRIAIEEIDKTIDSQKEVLKAAKKVCEECPLYSIDTKYNALNHMYNELQTENYALKQAYESKDTQVGDLIKVLSKLVND